VIPQIRRTVRQVLVIAAVTAVGAPAAGLAQECSPTDLATAEQSYSTAYQLVTAGQWSDAIPSLEMAVGACGTHWQSVELLSQAYWRSDRFDDAAASYQDLIQGQYGGQVAAAELRVLEPYGYVLLRAGKYPEAQEVLETVLSMDPANYRAHELLVHRFERSQMHEKAVEHLLRMEQLQSDDAQKQKLAKRIADTYKSLGESDKAAQWYAQTGGASTGLFKIGVDHMKASNWQQAIDAFTSYLEGKPDSAPALKNRGQCYQKLNQNAQARADYERVLELDASRHDVASSLGFLYLDAEMYNKAGALARNAIDTWDSGDGKLGGMYYLMGKVLEKRDEKYEEAITYFQRATSDAYWGEPAKKEIVRQNQLIEIREMQSKRGG